MVRAALVSESDVPLEPTCANGAIECAAVRTVSLAAQASAEARAYLRMDADGARFEVAHEGCDATCAFHPLSLPRLVRRCSDSESVARE